MLKLLRENKIFLILTVVFWVCLLVLIVDIPKARLHLLLNTYHTGILDVIFKAFTEVGGAIPFIVGGGLLFYRFGAALIVLIPQILMAIPLYIVKHLVDMPRPLVYFHTIHTSFPMVSGVDLCVSNSFPSGHTTAAFAMFLSLAFIVKDKPFFKVLFFILAVGVAYSRVYLSQHFAIDVLGGSVIGVLFTMGYIYLHNQWKRAWMDRSILTLRKKKMIIFNG